MCYFVAEWIHQIQLKLNRNKLMRTIIEVHRTLTGFESIHGLHSLRADVYITISFRFRVKGKQ